MGALGRTPISGREKTSQTVATGTAEVLLKPYPWLGDAYRFWDSRRTGPGCPHWTSVDVIDLKPWLGWVFLVDVDEAGEAWYRLVGTRIVERFHFDAAGRRVDDVSFGPNTEVIRAAYRACWQSGRPLLSTNVFIRQHASRLVYIRLLLPFHRKADQFPDRLMGCMLFPDRDDVGNWVSGVRQILAEGDYLLQ